MLSRWNRSLRCAALAVATTVTVTAASAQYNERPDLPGSGSPAVDCSGRSIKNQRVRAIHTTDPAQEGGTAYFLEKDPFLAYQLGRNLNFREFRKRDGVFDRQISQLAGPMPDGTTAKITANNQTSCSGCHNLPQGNPGGGPNFHKESGRGRNTPHYYGAGIVEMLALQIRADILRQLDTSGDGWIDAAEAAAGGDHVLVETTPGGDRIDYGRPALSNGNTGTPALNNVFRVWYVDAQGRPVSDATEVDGVETFGYNLTMVVWGWGQGPGRAALNPTNRVFLWDPWKAHGGLESHDPSTTDDPDGDGVSRPTLAGALQFPATHRPPDAGDKLHRLGFSRDDPDGDGYLHEISEGDLDLGEWFMLNAPRPAFTGTPRQYQRGVDALVQLGCTECHVTDWQIHERDEVFAGDRRLFDLDVRWNAQERRLEGRLVPLYHQEGDRFVREYRSFLATGLFTDLRHHDMGEEFAETDFGGTINTLWRTPPLWGVASGFPWGHDGRSLSMDDVIRRHGGEAEASRLAWESTSPAERRAVSRFLERLVLYDVESLPADVDGNGYIAEQFVVAGQDTGRERFNAEWLFRHPVQIQGPFVNTDGEVVHSFAAVNVDEAYGQLLPLRVDRDADGWPDVWDRAPRHPGYHNGVW